MYETVWKTERIKKGMKVKDFFWYTNNLNKLYVKNKRSLKKPQRKND